MGLDCGQGQEQLMSFFFILKETYIVAGGFAKSKDL
jgi:hypothetical protein